MTTPWLKLPDELDLFVLPIDGNQSVYRMDVGTGKVIPVVQTKYEATLSNGRRRQKDVRQIPV